MIFELKDICSWKQFCDGLDALGCLKESSQRGIFRGQQFDKNPPEKALKTSLERALDDYGIGLGKAPDIERKLIRDFRRRYLGPDRDLVLNDTLYCLSLMQHYGAPTRLLDCTYSPYVAVFFALERKVPSKEISLEDYPIVWCLNTDWCKEEAEKKARCFIPMRNQDATRNDNSFIPLYMGAIAYKLIFPENPVLLNERLIIQQGVFLCPGDVGKPFEENIKSLNNWYDDANIIKFRFRMGKDAHIHAIKELMRMNITRDSLFPGLQGFSESFKQRLLIYDE